jgi:nicotinate-nucleotide adenylyltransferase
MNRIGLFGGTFNPIHSGHVSVAEEVKAGYQLDRLIFIPAAVPPHKVQHLVPASDRLAMVALALANRNGLEVSDIELRRKGPSYTVDTLVRFQRIAAGSDLYFVLGIDAFLEIETWKDYQQLFRLAAFIVMTRPDHQGQLGWDRIVRHLAEFLPARISAGYRPTASGNCFQDADCRPVHLANVRPIAISATDVRLRIANRAPIDHLVPASVAGYIMRKGLYQ